MEKTIIGYDGCTIDECGTVRLNGRVLPTELNSRGYVSVKLPLPNGMRKRLTVHQLVAQAFIPNPQGLPEVDHLDGNTENNSAANLEWVTHAENCRRRLHTPQRRPIAKIVDGRIKAVYISAREAARQEKVEYRALCAAVFHQTRYKGCVWAPLEVAEEAI